MVVAHARISLVVDARFPSCAKQAMREERLSIWTLSSMGVRLHACPGRGPLVTMGSSAPLREPVGDNNYHLICRTCGRMVEVECGVGAMPWLTAADGSGY